MSTLEINIDAYITEATIQAIKIDLKEYIQGAVNRHYEGLDV
jgi:hypothetical protein